MSELNDIDETLASKRDRFLSSIKHQNPRDISVRDFLALWGYKRRGSYITRKIERELRERNLVSLPEIAKADYYGKVKVLDCRDLAPGADLDIGWAISTVLDTERGLTAVGPDDTLGAAETLMVMHDFSQIPVLSKSRRELHGAVTWKSLARFKGGLLQARSTDAMEVDIPTARSSDSLLDHIGTIITKDFLFIKDPTNLYVGILTTTDLAQNFRATSLPFIKIGEIEHRIRLLINRLPLPMLQAAKAEGDSRRHVSDASDLTLGEAIVLLQKRDNWELLEIPYDRVTILNNLDEVRDIRNDVVHFRPNLDEQTIDVIDWCLNWLRTLGST